MTFAACLPIILASEAGFVNNPSDPGGATNRGITLATYSRWLGRQATVADLIAIPDGDVGAIYLGDFYNPSGAAFCPPGVDLMVFDAAVNSGPSRAIKWLQAALGVAADGVIGPATRAAIAACDAGAVITAMAAARKAFDDALPTAAEFGAGWNNRITRTETLALAMAGAPNA